MKSPVKEKDIKKMLLGFKKFPVGNYDTFDLDRLVVSALYILEQNNIPLYFDFIAVGLFRLFPGKFSMANFAQFPDTNRISKALRRITDEKRKSWATGNIENGFYLTDLGREMAGQVLSSLRGETHVRRKPLTVNRTRGKSPEDDVHEIRVSDAYRKWSMNEDINNYELIAFLKAAPYTPKELLNEHIKQLKISATTAKDSEVLEFLSSLENKFKNILS